MFRSLIVLLSVLASPVAAQDYAIADLTVADPVARTATSIAPTSAGYLTITNTGDAPEKLLAIEADFPRVMLHESIKDGDVMKMEHLMSVDIAPGETVEFVPGGKHVMFMGLKDIVLEEGDEFPAVMVFENAGRLDIVFRVQTPADPDHNDH